MRENRGNRSLMSLMMHRLLLYPDHPFDIGEIWGKRFNPQTKLYETFLLTWAPDLSKDVVYPKERKLIEDIRADFVLAAAARCTRPSLVSSTSRHDWRLCCEARDSG